MHPAFATRNITRIAKVLALLRKHTARVWLLLIALVFLISSGAVIRLAYQIAQDEASRIELQFQALTDLVEESAIDHLDRPMRALRGLNALHALDQGFTQERLRFVLESGGFQYDYPGILGFGVIARVPSEGLDAFLAQERADQGERFSLGPLGSGDEHYIIKLIEPREINQAALGLDLNAEPVRRQSAELALLMGQPTISDVINLVQDDQRRPGFLILTPTWVSGTESGQDSKEVTSHIGFVYVAVLAEALFRPLFLPAQGLVHFHIALLSSEGEWQSLIRSTDYFPIDSRQSDSEARFMTDRHFMAGGQEFLLSTYSSRALESQIDTAKALQTGWMGVTLAGLLSCLLAFLMVSRSRAQARVAELTDDLLRQAEIARRTHDAVLITNPEGKITWANEAFTRISGFSLEESLGHKPGSLLQSEQTDRNTVAQIALHLAKREACHVEILNRHKNGHHYWLELEIQPLQDQAGQLTGFMAVERDITEAKESQERERIYTRKLNAALREASVLMQTIDTHAIVSEAGPDGRILRANDAFCRISGYSREELLGQDHRIVNSGTHDRAFWASLWETLSAGQPWRGQICNRAKDGSLYWVDSIIAPFMGADGMVERYVSIRFDMTARKELEQQLQTSQLMLERAGRVANVGAWSLDLQDNTTFWSEQTRRIHEVDDDFVSTLENGIDFYAPEARAVMARTVQQAIETGDSFDVELPLITAKGRDIWVRSMGEVEYEHGRPIRVHGAFQDITDRKTLQKQIEDQNQILHGVLENLPGALSAFDAELNLILTNTKFACLLDLPDWLLSKNPVTFESIIRYNADRGDYGEGDREAIIRAIVDKARNPIPHVLERMRPDGTTLEIRGLPLPSGGFVTTYTNVTERKEAERRARHADEMLRESIDALEEAFVIYDDQDRLLICNQRYRDTYAVAAKLMEPGRRFEEIVRHGAENGEYVEAIGRVDEWVAERLAIHRQANTEVIQELANGRYLRIVERKTSNGYTVGFRIDITELVRARLAAEQASRSKGQFLANMSHEIRTPMNAILGMLNLLQNTDLTNRQLDYVNKTHSAAQSLLGLLNDILDFSKVEAGKMTLESTPFAMDQLMRDLAVILSASTGQRPLEVLFEVDPRTPSTLIGDSLRLKQILINLGGNAIKFTEQGMVVLKVEVLNLQTDQVTLSFGVRDTGIGIAPEHLEHIFQGFSQAEASTTRRFGGTGLGLAISGRLVNLMGGRMQVESTPGKGSHFHFAITLPIGHASAQLIESPNRPDLQGLSVLIIDDNPWARDVLQTMITHMGWRAAMAASGEEGLARIEERQREGEPPFDAVFVDWQMPDMDGWATSQAIRKRLAHVPCPILIMVTAHGREMLTQRSTEEQALLNGFLVKPVTPSMILDAVSEALHRELEPAKRKPARRPTIGRLNGMKILLVEDNRINQQVAMELLAREGAQVTLADNGQLGVQAIAEAPGYWDVVLMDVQMPVMDGYTATRQVREVLRNTELAIIAMTANAMESDRQEALAAGMNAHVGKPFHLDDLVNTILKHAGAALISPSTSAKAIQTQLAGAQTLQLDLPAAMQRMGGNRDVLHRILQALNHDLADLPARFESLVHAEQWDEVARLMHTIKGTAATAGASALSACAAEAEKQFKNAPLLTSDNKLAWVEQLRQTVAALTIDLRQALEQLKPDTALMAEIATEPTEPAALVQALRELSTLLQVNDMRCLDQLVLIRQQLGGQPDPLFDTLDRAVNALDFELALRLIEQWLSKHEFSDTDRSPS